jgi:hypothetical protein
MDACLSHSVGAVASPIAHHNSSRLPIVNAVHTSHLGTATMLAEAGMDAASSQVLL